MPYPFVLPTTSAFSFSSSLACETHPSLPLTASTYRGVVRDTLKKHKRLPPSAQAANLLLVVSSLNDYARYLLAVVDGGSAGRQVEVVPKSVPAIEWRPTLSDGPVPVPGREPPRAKVQSLEHEVFFALSTLATALSLQARAALQPLYVTTIAAPGPEQRHAALTGATKHLLEAASIYAYLSSRSRSPSAAAPDASSSPAPPCPDIAPATVAAQRALALAEATLLAVLKDDPYPAVVAQDRNSLDRDWMFRAPDIPKVRAHLFARLCLAASEHAAQASSLCQGATGGRGLSAGFVRYIEDLRRNARAKACRFFGIDAELGGQTGTAIGWLRAGLQELGVESREARKGSGGSGGGGGLAGLGSRLKKEWGEKREDRKIEKGASWGADAGRLEETRVIEMLDAKWSKHNDTINTQLIPAPGTLLAQMPSGRDIHTVPPYEPPALEPSVLEAMRAPPDREDDFGNGSSSEDEGKEPQSMPVGAYPGTSAEYARAATSNSYY